MAMARLIFSKKAMKITLINGEGKKIGSWPAGNKASKPWVDPHIVDGNGLAPNGDWPFRHRNVVVYEPKYHESYGYYYYPIGDDDLPDERGIALHGGRAEEAKKRDIPQYEYPTDGCIRMNDADLEKLVKLIVKHRVTGDPVDRITIQEEAYHPDTYDPDSVEKTCQEPEEPGDTGTSYGSAKSR